MWQSLRISHMILRLSLAFVFLWFGIDKFFHPSYWITSWMPHFMMSFAVVLHVSPNAFIYSIGVIELLAGISFLTNIFTDFFALIAGVFLIVISLFYGFNEIFVRDIGLIGALFALVFWPNPGHRRYS